jgi:hypothetical protein
VTWTKVSLNEAEDEPWGQLFPHITDIPDERLTEDVSNTEHELSLLDLGSERGGLYSEQKTSGEEQDENLVSAVVLDGEATGERDVRSRLRRGPLPSWVPCCKRCLRSGRRRGREERAGRSKSPSWRAQS